MKNIYIIAFYFAISLCAFSQNKVINHSYKPRLNSIIIPSDNLMVDYDYILNPFNPARLIPDYSSAIEKNYNFNYIINRIHNYLSECNLPAIGLEWEIKSHEMEAKYDKDFERYGHSLYDSEQMMIADQIYTSINYSMDYIIKFYYTSTNNEFGKTTDISITVIDNFNKKIISTISSVSHEGKDLLRNLPPPPPPPPTGTIQIVEDDVEMEIEKTDYNESEIDVRLSSLIYGALINSNLCNEIVEYFSNLHFVEVDLQLNLECEMLHFDDLFSSDSLNILEKKLSTIVEGWLLENSIDSTYTISNISPSQMNIEGIRVPYLYKGRPTRAEDFAKKLKHFLRKCVLDPNGKYLKESYRTRVTQINEMKPERRKAKIEIIEWDF